MESRRSILKWLVGLTTGILLAKQADAQNGDGKNNSQSDRLGKL